ncbi:MAG TPA: radical SAM/Cys-rich domain protein [Sedimenticola sp.]|nr:radical SAM/Cys-rich domain protein [Sedimenticola sp.]
MLESAHLLFPSRFPTLKRRRLETLQVNLGYRCNQTCQHCHVNAGPGRTESMERETVEQVLEFLRARGIATLDLTGGAPELNPHFCYLVEQAGTLGVKVIDRCNLTILEEPGQEHLVDFLAANRVEVVASLPCYLEENVDHQRGKGVYAASIRGLQRLNAAGYGREGSGLCLNLVYNPAGPELPPPQEALEADYRRRLGERFGIRFNHLFTLANMPIRRFGSQLLSRGEFGKYLELLRDSFRPTNLEGLMCLSQISVDWRGYLFDCDFNQMLDLPLAADGRLRLHISELAGLDLAGESIRVAEHCYGCAAGQGSSCGGALAAG